MKRIVIITETTPLDTCDIVDTFVIDFGENKYTNEQLRGMLNLNQYQEVALLEYKEGELGIRSKK